MTQEKQPCVYIVTNAPRGVLYIGVTSDLPGRVWHHRSGDIAGFTKRYNCQRLVHFELFGEMELAIAREKQLKNWRRDWKLNLVEESNPNWRDLAEDFGFEPLG